MDFKGYERFLVQDERGFTDKAIVSRLARAGWAEDFLGMSLDNGVANDDIMYDSLLKIRDHRREAHGNIQNALRKYYIFKNGKEFPRLRYYHRSGI